MVKTKPSTEQVTLLRGWWQHRLPCDCRLCISNRLEAVDFIQCQNRLKYLSLWLPLLLSLELHHSNAQLPSQRDAPVE
jgi:hypothetical protein